MFCHVRAAGSRIKSTEEAVAVPKITLLYLEANRNPKYEITTQASIMQTGNSPIHR